MNRVAAHKTAIFRVVSFVIVAFGLAGCASSSQNMPSKSAPPSVESPVKSKERVNSPPPRDKAVEGTPIIKSPEPNEIQHAPDKLVIVEEADGGFEGDTFEEDKEDLREEIDELAAEIQGSMGQVQNRKKELEDSGNQAPGSCQEMCELSEAICNSSQKICGIADSHPSDGYFLDRCQWSRKECRTAGQQCSVCSP